MFYRKRLSINIILTTIPAPKIDTFFHWFCFRQPKCLNLQPEDMKALSSTRSSSTASSQRQISGGPDSTMRSSIFSAKQAQADITQSVSSIMAVSNRLEQDNMEGVDAKEWVSSLI